MENGCELGVARRFFLFGLVSPARLQASKERTCWERKICDGLCL
jgi:hypothetical protein